MRRGTRLFLLPLSIGIAACSGDALEVVTGEGPGTTGFAVHVTDDPTIDASPGSGPTGPVDFSGELDGSIRVALRSDGGALVDLGLVQNAVIELQQVGDTTALSDLNRPPTDTYVAVQLRFEGVSVRVDAGSEVGDTTLTQDAILNVGNGLATVEIATQPFTVTSEATLDVIVDLNSELWVTTTNLDDDAVPQADLTNNVTVDIL